MDVRRFDDLTRRLGSGASRRRLVAGALAAALAALGLGRAGGGASAQKTDPGVCAGVRCRRGFRCCDDCGTARCIPNPEPCPDALCGGVACGPTECGPEEYCCNESCGFCRPLGQTCPEQFCA